MMALVKKPKRDITKRGRLVTCTHENCHWPFFTQIPKGEKLKCGECNRRFDEK